MSDATPANGANPVPPRFEVAPYQPDGGFSPAGSALLIGVSMGAGMVLGVLASWVGRWFYLVLLFPAIFGVILGVIGAWAIKKGKIRSPWLGGLAGLLGGGMAMLTMHYCDFLRFRRNLEQVPEPIRAAALDVAQRRAAGNNVRLVLPAEGLKPQEQRALEQAVEDLIDEVQVDNLFRYIDLAARRGVSIGRAGGGNGRNTNLGYIGSYVYWAFELALVAGIAFGLTRGAAGEPFCTECQTWKKFRTLGTFPANRDTVTAAVQEGDAPTLAELNPLDTGGELVLSAAICPQCDKAAPIDVKLARMTYAKGELRWTDLAFVTYPGEALPVLEALFPEPAEPETTSTSPPEPAADMKPPDNDEA